MAESNGKAIQQIVFAYFYIVFYCKHLWCWRFIKQLSHPGLPNIEPSETLPSSGQPQGVHSIQVPVKLPKLDTVPINRWDAHLEQQHNPTHGWPNFFGDFVGIPCYSPFKGLQGTNLSPLFAKGLVIELTTLEKVIKETNATIFCGVKSHGGWRQPLPRWHYPSSRPTMALDI